MKTVQPDIIRTSQSLVSCEGQEGSMSSERQEGEFGHPRVYLDMEKRGFVVCPYCSRRFERQAS